MARDNLVTRGELDDALEGVHDDVAKIVGVLEDMAGSTGSADGESDKAGRWRWATLGAEDRVALWYGLREWVDWYNARYGYAHADFYIPPCWPKHSIAVEELTALMVSHQAAHAVTEPSDALIAWHDRWLWPAISRLRKQAGGGFARCTTGSHDVKNEVSVSVIADNVFARYVHDDVAAHNEAPSNEAAPGDQEVA
ncbi:hypothetical protein [Oerskovia paurometabola]|uniref:hypothetical protein n=1 Tax=Oerskovia paurometabola TaxID=162170 RepID=UPI0037FCA690